MFPCSYLEGTDERKIHQAAKQRVQLPTTVKEACKVTNQSNEGGLSKKCHVQAHMALTNAGSIPQESDRQYNLLLTSANIQTNKMATVHSITLETWTTQVGIESAFINYIPIDRLF